MNSFNASDWMQDSLTLTGNRKLIDICITGSHDSGMSIVQHGTIGSNACNTQTQTYNIGQQLAFGARYFDIRPVIGSGDYYTGHYSKISIPVHGPSMQGSRGQLIEHIVDEINAFTAQHAELVILNLSHDMDTDSGNENYPSFTQAQWNGLFETLAQLQALYVTSPNQNFCESTLNSLIGDGKAKVIVIVEPDNVNLGPYLGKGFYPNANFKVYNEYADTSDFTKMANDQFAKMETVRGQSEYFLLSWTLTQGTEEVLACLLPGDPNSIRKAADQANAQLASQIAQHTTPKLYPNILYTDNIIDDTCAQIAVSINEQAAP
ncbi:hypothetical protein [Pseudoalteromonas sp. OOF1S-7]|uniref:hypothetical protein n=1 Tax=Pseudoalteromonas sp. OOF1S-7 TaxID=2917757 RepID=UPI001EF64BC6|nr:hypothetical protein [Pseudoalteromonas sp. OOF1S-7]MCG7534093.1 hypothetical protein [Pseudoalteromonas sp. OOF1S-7]